MYKKTNLIDAYSMQERLHIYIAGTRPKFASLFSICNTHRHKSQIKMTEKEQLWCQAYVSADISCFTVQATIILKISLAYLWTTFPGCEGKVAGRK